MSRQGSGLRTSSYAWGIRHSTTKSSDWQEGEIAYLKSWDLFQDDDWKKLERPKKHMGASNHPVIILKKGKPTTDGQFYLVTTVSAYSSGEENGYLPPWRQRCHRAKDKGDFRSFSGAELVNNLREPLQLEQGQHFPKPKTSWVYIQSTIIVPESVLGPFNKTPVQLRMTTESHHDLVRHMETHSRQWKTRMADKRICTSDEVVKPARTVAAPWRLEPIAISTKATTMPAVAEVSKTPAPEPKAGPASIVHKRSWASITRGEGTNTSSEKAGTSIKQAKTIEQQEAAPIKSYAAACTAASCSVTALEKQKSHTVKGTLVVV